jgi:hypothetical protein
MKPSQVADRLYKIAAAIDNSNQPSQKLVVQDLHNLVALMLDRSTKSVFRHKGYSYDSGGSKRAAYEFVLTLTLDSPETKIFKVKGKVHPIKGKAWNISGEITFNFVNGEFDGYDYQADPNTSDPLSDPTTGITSKDFPVIEAAAAELGLDESDLIMPGHN